MRYVRTGFVVLTGLLIPFLGPRAGAAPAPTPITSCDFPANAAGTYKLTADRPCPGKSGVIVGANFVTIDLGGHTLTGDDSVANKDGIDNSAGFDHVTVKNGTVAQFSRSGVDGFGGANSMHVQNVLASGNIVGLSISGNAARITSSQAAGNYGRGIEIFGNSAGIKSSRVSGNDQGIYIQGDFARVRSSHISGNAQDGLYVTGDAPKIGQLRRGPVSDKNHADANGYSGTSPDGAGFGIDAVNYTTPPVGRNEARGNDNETECEPSNLCN